MAIEALIFDLGGVILELDWEKYREDNNPEVPGEHLWSVDEKLNPVQQVEQALQNFFQLDAQYRESLFQALFLIGIHKR